MTKIQLLELVLQSLIVPLILYAITVIRNYLMARTASAAVDRVLYQAAEAATLAVQKTSQTYVDNMRRSGQWTQETQQAAFNQAMQVVKSLLTVEGTELLAQVVGDVNAYLTALIEAAVREGKQYYNPHTNAERG